MLFLCSALTGLLILYRLSAALNSLPKTAATGASKWWEALHARAPLFCRCAAVYAFWALLLARGRAGPFLSACLLIGPPLVLLGFWTFMSRNDGRWMIDASLSRPERAAQRRVRRAFKGLGILPSGPSHARYAVLDALHRLAAHEGDAALEAACASLMERDSVYLGWPVVIRVTSARRA